mmetsp:Transcript_72204/g.165407  ORF Transcript_72204/g.165407 Transcript_72204/m.165407 type:complete len:320 (-) Transcript_72204:45-1004(-)
MTTAELIEARRRATLFQKRREYVVAGGIAGVISRTAIAPVERVKILFQISKASPNPEHIGYWRIVPLIYKEEGFLAFWKGNTAAVIRVVPYMSITFLAYEEYKVMLRGMHLETNLVNLGAGSLAGITAVAATYPLDLVRARLAKQNAGLKSPKYSGMWDALINIPREQGRMTGDGHLRMGALYRGLFATMVGEAPYAGLKFCCYEAMKVGLADFWGVRETELGPVARASCGALSGLMAVNFVYPFDVVRRRMQTHEGERGLYRTPFHAIAQIVREEGVRRGLYRGLTLNYIKTVPNVAIYMSLYDVVKNRLLPPIVEHT